MSETYGYNESRSEKIIYDMANYHGDKQAEHLKFMIGEEAIKRISTERAMKDVVEVSGLTENPFLYKFYQRKFTEISSGDHLFEEQKLRDLLALMGLCMERFFYVDLPISEAIRSHVDPSGDGTRAPRFYHLSEIRPWAGFSVRLSGWDQKFDKYFRDRERIESGQSDISLSDLDFENDFKLRFRIAESITRDLKAEISRLLSQPAKNPAETVERNSKLRLLITEVSRWPSTLKCFAWPKLRVLKKVKDPFSNLILDFVSETEYAGTFNLAEFNRKILDYYWTKLFSLVKPGTVCDEEQNRVLKIIKLEMEALTQNG